MWRMRWYQAGCFTLALALGVAIEFLFDLTPEQPGYWLILYPEILGVILFTVALYQSVEEGRVDWVGIARAVLALARYGTAVLIVAVPVFVLRSFFPWSWLGPLNLALALGFALNVVVILVLATVLSSIEHRSFKDVLLNVRRDDQK